MERHVAPLPRQAARELALREQPGLSHFVRERLLEESAGNPLALIELGAALAADPDTTLASGQTLPLSQRLLRLYADRIRRLPQPARTLLLAAALEPSCDGAVLRSVAAGTRRSSWPRRCTTASPSSAATPPSGSPIRSSGPPSSRSPVWTPGRASTGCSPTRSPTTRRGAPGTWGRRASARTRTSHGSWRRLRPRRSPGATPAAPSPR